MKQRLAWLDYVRFFSIFLVVLFHTPPRLAVLDDAVILNLRVPVFFCISGFLYSFDRWKGFRQYARHRAQQILVPYCTFFVAFYVLWLAVGRSVVGEAEQAIPLWQPLVEFVTGNPHIVVAPFWYIACLFTMQMLYYGVECLVPRRWVLPACFAIAAATYLIPYEIPAVAAVGQFWNLGNALTFLPFYALGNCCKKWLGSLQFRSPKRNVALLVCAAAAINVMLLADPLKVADPGAYRLVRIVAGVMIIPCYLCLAKEVATRFGRNPVVEMVVVSGTVYLGLQNYFIGVFRLVAERLFGAGVLDDHLWLKFAIAIVVMVAIYPIAVFIDRHARWILGKSPQNT